MLFMFATFAAEETSFQGFPLYMINNFDFSQIMVSFFSVKDAPFLLLLFMFVLDF